MMCIRDSRPSADADADADAGESWAGRADRVRATELGDTCTALEACTRDRDGS